MEFDYSKLIAEIISKNSKRISKRINEELGQNGKADWCISARADGASKSIQVRIIARLIDNDIMDMIYGIKENKIGDDK